MEYEPQSQARQVRMQSLLAEVLQDSEKLSERRKQEMHQVHDLVAQRDLLGCVLGWAISLAFVLAMLSVPQMLSGNLSASESLMLFCGVGGSALLWLLLRSLRN